MLITLINSIPNNVFVTMSVNSKNSDKEWSFHLCLMQRKPHSPAKFSKEIFDEYEGFYTLLLKRVTDMAHQGKSLEEIKKELKMPEYADWAEQDHLGVNIAVAYASMAK